MTAIIIILAVAILGLILFLRKKKPSDIGLYGKESGFAADGSNQKGKDQNEQKQL